MINVVLAYSYQYGQYAGNVLRSIRATTKNVKIYAIIDDPFTPRYSEVNVYIERKINIEYPNLYGTKHIKNMHNIVFNYCYLPEILKDIDRVIVVQIDQIFQKDLIGLWMCPTSPMGIAAPAITDPNTATTEKCLKNFSNGYPYKGAKAIRTFIDASMVLDLEKMRARNAVKIMHEMITKHEMAELMAFNLYSGADWTEVDERWAISANNKKSFGGDEIWGLHWHGANPWDRVGPYNNYWKRYNK